jgi:hypothetical protein
VKNTSFGYDLKNGSLGLQQVWHVKEPSLLKVINDKQRYKFAVLSPLTVITVRYLKIAFAAVNNPTYGYVTIAAFSLVKDVIASESL